MNSSQSRERSSWCLLAALAAIAFALVAVVGMPKVALAASSVSELAKAINNGNDAPTSPDGGAEVYYNGNTVYVVGECNGNGSGIGDIWMHLSNEDVNLDIDEKGSIKFAQGSQLIIMNDGDKDVAFNISGSGSITGGGIYDGSNNYAAIQVGGQSGSKNLSGNLNISGTVAVNGQQGSPALTVTFGSTAGVAGGEFVGGGDGTPGGQAVINVGEPVKGREGTLTVSGDVTVTANEVKSGNACMALCVSNGTATLNGGTFTGGGMNATKKARISAVGVGSQLLGGDGSVFPGDLIVNGATIEAPEEVTSGGGIAVYGTSTLTVKGNSNVSGERAVSTQGECNGATINIEGGKFTGADNGAAFYLPNNGETPVNDVNISGGTISGGAGIVNLGSDVSITGTPGPIISSTGSGEIEAGDSKITFPAAGIVNTVASGDAYGAGTTTSVTGGTVNNGIVNGVEGQNSNLQGDPKLTVGGTATVNATDDDEPAITNNSGKTTVEDGTINGDVVNGATDEQSEGYAPSVEMNGGVVSGSVTTNAGTTDLEGGIIDGGVTTSENGTTNVGVNDNGTGTGAGPTVSGEITGKGTNVYGGSFDQTATQSLNEAQEGTGPSLKSPASNYFGSEEKNATGTIVDVTGTDTSSNNKYTGTTMPNLENDENVDSVTVESVASGDDSTLKVPDKTLVKNDSGESITTQSPSSEPITVPAGSQATPDAPTQEPTGDASAIQSQVLGVKAPIINDMKPYADVTVSADLYTWTIEANEDAGDTPATTISQNLVVPILGAIQRGGCTLATSAQVSSIQLEVPGSTQPQQLEFANQVLANAVPITNSPAKAQETTLTLADLEGKTCGVIATTTTGTLTYTFNFVGETPEPPAATTEPVYRLYNDDAHLHLYTSDQNEIETLKTRGWVVDFEGEPCWYAPLEGTEDAAYEIVRLSNPYNGDHYFVKASDTYQINVLLEAGMTRDSGASSIWSAADTETNVEVSTLYNPFADVDTHLYSPNQVEIDSLLANDWELNTPIIWGVPAPEEA